MTSLGGESTGSSTIHNANPISTQISDMLFWRTSIVLESLTWLYSHTKYPLERVFLMDYELLDLELIFCLFNG